MNYRQNIVYIVMTIIWMAMIFYLSSIPDLKSSLPSLYDLIARKIAHMAEYGILYVLIRQSMRGYRHASLLALVVAVLYAVSDEIHQSFVSGRSGSIIDVGIDTVGVIASYSINKKASARNR